MDDKAMVRSQMHEYIAQQGGQFPFVDTEDLNAGSRRIGQRTQEIQHGPDTHLLSWSSTMFHGSMIERDKKKADPDLIDTIGYTFGRQIDLHPEGRKHVCASRFRRH